MISKYSSIGEVDHQEALRNCSRMGYATNESFSSCFFYQIGIVSLCSCDTPHVDFPSGPSAIPKSPKHMYCFYFWRNPSVLTVWKYCLLKQLPQPFVPFALAALWIWIFTAVCAPQGVSGPHPCWGWILLPESKNIIFSFVQYFHNELLSLFRCDGLCFI